MKDQSADKEITRRDFLRQAARAAVAAGVGGGLWALVRRAGATKLVWQIDPDVCTTCGNCATYCVLDISAVKAVQCYDMCAMCDLCPGYFDLGYLERSTAAENQLCPTGAVIREFIADQAGVHPSELRDVLELPTDHAWLDYDKEADVLYVSFRKPQRATKTIETDDDILIRKDGRKIVGLTILNARARAVG